MWRLLLFNIFIGLTMGVFGQCPSVSIVASDTQYCHSDSVYFSVSGVPVGSTIAWNLGAGYDTAGVNYSKVIAASGYIDVILQFTTPNGTVCNHVEYDVTRVIPPLDPQFDASRLSLCNGPDTIVLYDKTIGSVARSWIINGIPVSNAKQAQVVNIASTDPQNITLVSEDQYGCRTVSTFADSVKVYDDIVVDFTKSNNSNCYPITTNFNSSYTTNQQIDSFRWDLPGSVIQSATTKNVSNVAYSNVGVFDVSFNLFTSNGCSYSLAKPKFVKLGDVANLALSVSEPEICVSEEVIVTETISPLPGKLTWDVGSYTQTNSGKYKVQLVFRDTGFFDITVNHDHNGCISSYTLDSFVRVKGISGDFISSGRLHCDTPHTVQLVNTSSISTGVMSTLWQVKSAKDNSLYYSSTDSIVNVQFDSLPAKYHVELITTDSFGCTDTFRRLDYIDIHSYDFKIEIAEPEVACIGQQVRFFNNTPLGSELDADQFFWTFYDKDTQNVLGTSSLRQGRYTYADTGTYSIKLRMFNSVGCKDSTFVYDAVTVVQPVLDYRISDTAVCFGDSFLCEGFSTPSDAFIDYEWRFVNQTTGKIHNFDGDSVPTYLDEIGIYDFTMIHNIEGGCLDSIKRKIYVNGTLGNILLDSASGCSPFVIKPKFQVLHNIYAGGADSSLKYNWIITPSTTSTLDGATSASPVAVLLEKDDYEISLYVTNSSGCGNYNSETSTVLIGVEALYQRSTGKLCKDQIFNLKNRTLNSPTSLEWQVFPGTNYTLDTIDFENYEFAFHETGNYQLFLIAGKDSQCFDTFFRQFFVEEVIADFEVSDTFLICAPQDITVYNQSFNADSLFWNFDDGIYLANDTNALTHSLPDNRVYDIELIAKSPFGCLDTIVKQDLVEVAGPYPNFSVDNLSGCGFLQATFTDLSIDAVVTIFDFGDGTIDSSGNTTHVYQILNGNDYQDFIPSLTVRDIYGCTSTVLLDTFIRVYNKPIITQQINPDTVLCQNEKIYFSELDLFTDSVNWFLDNQLVSVNSSDSFLLSQNGTFQFKHVAMNIYGCKDSVITTVEAKEAPKISFVHDSISCLNSLFEVNASVASVVPVQEYYWQFGEPSNPDNIQAVSTNPASISYLIPGLKKIKVNVILTNGCKGIDSTLVRVLNPATIPTIDLKYVSVTNPGVIEVNHETTNYPHFEQYQLYRNDSLINIETDRTASYFKDIKVLYGPDNYCYSISILDQCQSQGPKSRTHCPVILTASSTVHKQIDLNWTPYMGWDSVLSYEVYTIKNGQSTLLGTTPGNVLTLIDSPLCEGIYTYQVYAIKHIDGYVSKSNIEDGQPIYIGNTTLPSIRVVTVNEGEEIEVYWPPSDFSGFDHYVLDKYQDAIVTPVFSMDLNQNSYLDPDVNTATTSYIYTVKEVDDCDIETNYGRYGKSIVLSGVRNKTSTSLSWTSYLEWLNDVDRYEVLYKEVNGYKVLASLPRSVLSYEDFGIHKEDPNGFYRYRIRAINIENDTSYSNLIYIKGDPLVLIPNAFSPNGDGLNDVFRPFMVFVASSTDQYPKDFEVSIYNRWGEKVYYSTDRDGVWNGTYKDKEVQQGVYFYTMKVTSVEGLKSYFNGTITLLRGKN